LFSKNNINSESTRERVIINNVLVRIFGTFPEMPAIVSINLYKTDNGKFSTAESEKKSKTSQIIEPIINTVVSGTITSPVMIPMGASTPKTEPQTPAVARNAPQETASGCNKTSGALPANNKERGLPINKIPSSAKYERINDIVFPADGVTII